MRLNFRKTFVLFFLLLFVFGSGCTKAPSAALIKASEPQDIKIWAVVDDEDAYSKIIAAYRAVHPQIHITFRRFRQNEYEKYLLNAMAEDRGPDIFLIRNDWVSRYQSKIAPMPAYTKMVYKFKKGGYTSNKEEIVLKNEKSKTVMQIKNDYPDVVAKDVLRIMQSENKDGKKVFKQEVLALPMSVDTLVMYVNKDILNIAGIPVIPNTWSRFQSTIKRLVKLDAEGNIVQAGAALGTADNIEHPVDLLSILMMQNGTDMVDDSNNPTFAQMPARFSGTRKEIPALQAITFFHDFADSEKDIYSWNADLPNVFDMFVQGRLAYYFGYSYTLPLIRARAPKLNLAIAHLPQIEGNPEVNFASYWVWTVSKKSKHTDTAWNILNFFTKQENEKIFLDTVKRPAAHKQLLEKQLEDEDLAVFASQVLTSQSWYRGYDSQAVDDIFKDMIRKLHEIKRQDWLKLLRLTQSKVEQTMQPKRY